LLRFVARGFLVTGAVGDVVKFDFAQIEAHAVVFEVAQLQRGAPDTALAGRNFADSASC
jgi:hypothetical protein